MKDFLEGARQDAQSPQAAKLWEEVLQKLREVASKFLVDAEENYNAGDKQQLATAIQVSALLGAPAPKWAQDALLKASTGGPLQTWDDVLDRPAGPPDSAGKRKRPETAFRHTMLSLPICAAVELLRSQNRKVEPDLFDEVGEGLGISGRTASRIYYDNIETAGLILRAIEEGLASIVGKEVATTAMTATLSMAQRLTPEEFIGLASNIRERALSDNPIKGDAGLDAMGPEISRFYAHLSENRKKLTKTS